MAKRPGLDFQSAKGVFGELKRRMLFVIGALTVFRIGSFVPIPGINTALLAKMLEQQRGTIIEMFNMFSGGALSRASIFALGIMPYISSSIIIQLLMVIHPVLAEVKKEGESGRRKISQYTRYGTLILAIFQSIGIATSLPRMPGMYGLVINPGLAFYFTAVVSLVTGTMFLMWLGEQITERGIGNGISIIIFAGIVAGLPPAIGHTIEQARQGELHFLLLMLVAILVFVVTFFVVFVERSQRRIVVNYAKRQQGRRMYAAQSTHLPLKVNMAGVIPAIFASSIILFPATIASWFGGGTGWHWLTTISLYLQPGQPLYVLLYAAAIIFFCFFYTAFIFSPRETADNLKKSGAFVPGIRPGEQTAKYIDKVMTRLTLIGAFYITFICLIPEFMRSAMKVPFYFGGTSLLIVVVVIMDFMAQVQTMMMSSRYDSVLKKANLKGYGR
ncbi:preprotein translocase subunit SecY [Pantoea sp. Nvir]|uniref:preprotein translocase subunit SecY n=1 Tax=Pantoea sp. Nvir TaxID=2576760 RepID=UPI00135A0A09|nr:preprotein translocase subunit SecY [Pantoea sp. Nvir]MXP66497.1 preprotein translocase subunit SecY [Pantoea sp. Nvir]CAJ0993509.1 Protein translocase subunit SecY [Pantoea sp. Nvir]